MGCIMMMIVMNDDAALLRSLYRFVSSFFPPFPFTHNDALTHSSQTTGYHTCTL